MKKYDLLSISPIDGRYFEICHGMAELFSEYALIKNRVLVEVKWLIFLSDLKEIKNFPKLSSSSRSFLLKLHSSFSIKDAEKIKKPEEDISSETKECPMCAETIKAKAIICRFCNHKFEPDIIG